jgi:hypothetical protein
MKKESKIILKAEILKQELRSEKESNDKDHKQGCNAIQYMVKYHTSAASVSLCSCVSPVMSSK